MIVGKVTVNMRPIDRILKDKGLTAGGDVQRFHTSNVFRRMGKYMPHRSGAMETKLTHIKSDTEIETLGPYAQYQYYGKVMVDAKTGKGPANIPLVGPRFRRGAVLKVTGKDLSYTKTFNPQAGPFWDRRLVSAEGKAMQADLQRYVNRKAGKR